MKNILWTSMVGLFLWAPAFASDPIMNVPEGKHHGFAYQRPSDGEKVVLGDVVNYFQHHKHKDADDHRLFYNCFLAVYELPSPALRLHGYRALLRENYVEDAFCVASRLCLAISPDTYDAFVGEVRQALSQTRHKTTDRFEEIVNKLRKDPLFTFNESKHSMEIDFLKVRDLQTNTPYGPSMRINKYKEKWVEHFDLKVFDLTYGVMLTFQPEQAGLLYEDARRRVTMEISHQDQESIYKKLEAIVQKYQRDSLWLLEENRLWLARLPWRLKKDLKVEPRWHQTPGVRTLLSHSSKVLGVAAMYFMVDTVFGIWT